MEEVKSEITNIRVSLAELHTEVKNINENIKPINQMSIDIGVLKSQFNILLIIATGIFIAVAAGLILEHFLG